MTSNLGFYKLNKEMNNKRTHQEKGEKYKQKEKYLQHWPICDIICQSLSGIWTIPFQHLQLSTQEANE